LYDAADFLLGCAFPEISGDLDISADSLPSEQTAP